MRNVRCCRRSRAQECRSRRVIGSTFASSTIPFSGSPGLAVELLELESQFTGSLTQARRRQDVAE